MNDLSHWENQLRSWTPRSASEKLRANLFDTPAAEDVATAFGGRWNWLAPAMACFLLLIVAVTPQNDSGSSVAANGTNNLLADFVSFHTRENRPERGIFQWTNRERSVSISTLAIMGTNSL